MIEATIIFFLVLVVLKSGSKNIKEPLLIAVTMLSLSACTTIGPADETDWLGKVVTATPPSDGVIQFKSAAEWMPDTDGYAETRALLGPQVLPAYHTGVLVLSEKSVLFLEWNRGTNSYIIAYRLARADITQLSEDKMLRARRIVLTGKDYRPQSFEVYGRHGLVMDLDAEQNVLKILSIHVGALQ